ncbi:nitrite/sulfite reductase [Sulfurisphaera ohwakuensis]|uniref:Ferredoxin-nitrite reductase n=1 Tax=Sulfurisphaera ohwakuensis TaxID=69656 RepID=A0A650CG21_SULOH|nr:nitrite/sulfite reductase [Sulfurisphaera ohwakuensis]MBB5254942.1 ferredoxin-nitrite reductase [Sulfurisphaera ohwakuensis]QGR16762.1 hypothetical protein D1869_05845 [Sulfurisphaera ohwakuensis]
MKYSDKFKLLYPERFKGIYSSRGDNDLISIRIRQGKERDPSTWWYYQLETLGEISKRFGNGKVHFTTRGDIELYGIHLSDKEKVLKLLESVELDPRDSCGASVRNVLPCPSYLCPYAKIDATKAALDIAIFFRHNPEYEYPKLPKRIKISISACEKGCSAPVIMDVGIVARGENIFDVYIGGGIGDHDFEGVKLFEGVTLTEAKKISIAVANILKRENEKRGFKWVVQKYGIQKIKELIYEEMRKIEIEEVKTIPPKALNARIMVVRTKGSWLDWEDVIKVAEIAKKNFGFVSLFNTQTIFIPVKEIPKDAEIIEYPYLEKEVEACIGDDFCPPAIISTTQIAEDVLKIIGDKKIKIHISGCSHSCGRHQIADIGFVGVMRNGRKRLRIYVGGNNYKLGKVVGEIDLEHYPIVVEKLKELNVNDITKVKEVLEQIPTFTQVNENE